MHHGTLPCALLITVRGDCCPEKPEIFHLVHEYPEQMLKTVGNIIEKLISASGAMCLAEDNTLRVSVLPLFVCLPVLHKYLSL